LTETTTAQRPIADGLFELVDGAPVLVGSRCTACGTVAFPSQGSCPRCTSEAVERHLLARTGPLWTWTTQGFRPKSPPYTGPEEFVPYAVGYVELGGEIRVEGVLTEADPARLRIGLPMRVVARQVLAAEGDVRVTFAFAPDTEAAAGEDG
jgi:uncharacterized OB-fold protein